MGRKIDYPFNSEGKEFEYYYKVYQPNANGDINITLRLNTVNDKDTYRWTYGNVKEYNDVGATKFFKPLKAFLKELVDDLRYCWEWEDAPSKRKYIITSILTNVPVYNGGANIIEKNEMIIKTKANNYLIMKTNRA